MKKYFIIGLSALILELASTMYIKNVAERSVLMIFWAFISPFLVLPFVGYMVESKNWSDRIIMAICQALGYAIGSIIVYLISFNKL